MNWKQVKPLEYLRVLWQQYKAVLLVLAVGIGLMLLPTGQSAAPEPAEAESSAVFDLEAFEGRLARTLSLVEGAGETTVMLTLKHDGLQVLAQDVERDGERTSTATVTLGRGSGSQEVVTLQRQGPQFQGAVVVCAGGGTPSVRLALTQAVAALTGLGSDRISICAGR